MQKPLAYRMRPTNIDEVVGQQHLVGPHKIIRRMVEAKMLSSMILYGPPGIGKTSIASAIAGSTKYAFRMLNAATDSKKDLQIVAAEAKMSGTVVLMLDEIHRLDKTKQDFLLPLLESGSIILIGATTENPYINISPAIRSRVQIFELKPLDSDDLKHAVKRALNDNQNGLGKYNVKLDENALDLLVSSTNGDLRSILNGLELSVMSTKAAEDGSVHIDLQSIEESVQRKAISSDKDGDSHYDVMSAFQKSIRGSDPDAALLYLARLLEAGDLTSAIRRLMICAYEDVGLANPQACARAVQAAQVAQMVGLPEARIPLADAVIDLCLCPKSNSGMVAIDSALDDVRNGKANSIPDDLKDAHYSGAKKLGHGVGYKFPHDYPNSWVDQQYLPNNLINKKYYQPNNTGKYEQALNLRIQQIHEWKMNSKRSPNNYDN
ncbi:replication-associated recombination protein A [Companilactobacillus nantensis]|uniref:Chromosome segregation helicase n=1 Tax=Companilactobacillus nantensis DSM 16982 TaxID=1423774 RepID=A0A0R1W9T1_9LACO|nr:replication-associated recombination protein A [Companilactobacillus nantensis]KRM14450.1 chromosome segregation helicase [Companilactobacillus nantensis DSM 16982]GEO65245.1 recombinase RarA [Companilactobacillus nantensis]